MKLFLSTLICILVIVSFENNLFSAEKNIKKSEDTLGSNTKQPSLDVEPFYTFAVGIRGGINITSGNYSDLLPTSPFLSIYTLFNPFLIDNFLIEGNLTGLTSSPKTDDNGTYNYLSFGIGARYGMKIIDMMSIYGIAGGGGSFENLSSDYQQDNKDNYFSTTFFAGIGLETDIDYNYLISLDGRYNISLGKPHNLTNLQASLGISYAFNAKPESQLESYVEIVHNLHGIYPAMMNHYSDSGFGIVTITNRLKDALTNVKVTIQNDEYIKGGSAVSKVIQKIPSKGAFPINIKGVLTPEALNNMEDKSDQFIITVECKINSLSRKLKFDKRVTLPVYKRNAINWENTRYVGSFITLNDKAVENFSRKAINEANKIKAKPVLAKNIKNAMIIYSALCNLDMTYVSDPSGIKSTSKSKAVVDKVQFPREFLESKTGDCDDFTILYSSLLENIGIKTAIITIPGHIFMAFDTGVKRSNRSILLSGIDDVINTADGKTWLLIETTMIGIKESFWQANRKAYVNYKRYRAQTEFIYTEKCLELYPPASLPLDTPSKIMKGISSIYQKDTKLLYDKVVDKVKSIKKKEPQISGAIYTMLSEYKKAKNIYKKMLKKPELFRGKKKSIKYDANIGLGNIYFMQEKYNDAIKNYKKAIKLYKKKEQAYYGLCLCYSKMNKKSMLKKYLKKLPDYLQKDFESSAETRKSSSEQSVPLW